MFTKRNNLKKHTGKVHGVKCNFCPEYVKDTILSEHITLFNQVQLLSKQNVKDGDMNSHVLSVHGIEC